MGEALIWYRRRGGVDPELLKPTTITNNGNYTAPITGTYRVYTVGGGGGGGGGCRNAWNVSQVFYGGAGTRGTLNVVNVTLNQGDNVVCTIGAGGTAGTNNTTRTSYTNGTYNSRGTNGTAGGSTSFGSYGLGSGGTSGKYSWSRTYWSNTNMGWNNTPVTENVLTWNNVFTNMIGVETNSGGNRYYNFKVINEKSYWENGTSTWTTGNYIRNFGGLSWQNVYIKSPRSDYINNYFFVWQLLETKDPANYNFTYWENMYSQSLLSGWRNTLRQVNGSYTGSLYQSKSNLYVGWVYNTYLSNYNSNQWYFGETAMIIYNYFNRYYYHYTTTYNNRVVWNNKIMNTSTRCYTSIQVGSWWYLNNNTVTTFGSRIYRGDGGNSGRPGNAGYILVIPPQS